MLDAYWAESCQGHEAKTSAFFKVYSTPADMRGGVHISAADGRHRINLNDNGLSCCPRA